MTETPPPQFLTTREVADLLRVRERKVYDMAAEGTIPHRRVTGKLLFPRAELDAWLAGDGPRTAPDVVAGSHDPLLDWAIRESGAGLATLFDGSLDGLDRLSARQAIAAGLHLFDAERGDWNIAHVSTALGQAPVVLVAWAQRQQGLILSRGAAADIRGIPDLAGRRVMMRQPAAGAGLLFGHLLGAAGLAPADLVTEGAPARTETEAAAAVAAGLADAAPGLEAAARAFGLAFVPTLEERFDLVVDRRAWFEPPIQKLMAFARTPAFAEKADALGGYDISGLGTVRWNAP